MGSVTLRFYGDLNDFLPRQQQYQALQAECAGHETIKHLVEVCGVPHPEIEALLANGQAVDFGYLVQPDDQLEVYPAGSSVPVPVLALRPPLPALCFILDTHLGRLAAYLRLLGYDTLYRNDFADPELAQLGAEQQRMLLTRDVGLLKRSMVIHGAFVRATRPTLQLYEVARRFKISATPLAFQRCIRCNSMTRAVEKAHIEHLLKPKTRQFFQHFRQCDSCGRIYWPGSHYLRMAALIEQLEHQQQLASYSGAA